MGGSREIDDPYNRILKEGSYKDERFNGKRTIRDDYTGKKLYYSNAADAKHKHPIEKLADVDHITPCAVVRERFSDLSIEQQKSLANAKYNYAIVNAKLNRCDKNRLENHEYLQKKAMQTVNDFLEGDYDSAKTGVHDLINQTPRMLGKEAKSRACMAVQGNAYRVKNTADDLEVCLTESIELGNCAVVSAQIPLLTNALTNSIQVVQGEISVSDAASDIAMQAGGVWVQGIVADKAKKAIESGNNQMLLKISDIAKIPEVSTAEVAVGISFVRLINGEIDENEFVTSVEFEIVRSQVPSVITKIAGGLTIPIPVVGQLVGAAMVSVLCDKVEKVCRSIYDVHQSLKHISDNAKEISYLATVARKEIEEQRKNFREYTEKYNAEIQSKVNDAFRMIQQGVTDNSYEKTTDGLEMVANIFDTTTTDINMKWLKDNWKGAAGSWG